MIKRLFDASLAGAGLLVSVPLWLVIPLAIKLEDGGPVFFPQARVGLNGRVFRALKFRSMRPDAEKYTGPVLATENDPRITSFGRLLRLSHVDELPQVVNIVKGDLSMVGPRPEQPHYVEELREKLPFYDLRHLVRPGLTGGAQVTYGYAGDERDALEKLQYEFFYLRNQSLAFDCRIVLRTFRSVTGGRGAGR